MRARGIAVVVAAFFASGASYQGASVNFVQGNSTNIAVNLDCRSFGATTTSTEGSPGTLNIKYGDPVICWASRTTVSGTRINGEGSTGASTDWTPEAWVDWDWNDTSLGTVSRAGRTWDLGNSVGNVAAHVYRSSGTKTVAVTINSLVGGVRDSDSATVTINVEATSTTYPTPVAFCDDANCADDAGVPAGTIHGGDGTTDLATILNYCDANGSEYVLVEGGVTFTTSSAVNVDTRCLIESYGGSKATFDINTSTQPKIDVVGCAKYVVSGVTWSGNDVDSSSLFGGGEGEGCVVLDNFNVATAVGSRLAGIIQSGGGVNHPDLTEWYFSRFLYDAHCACGPNSFYIQANYAAWIGGEVSASGEHMIRTANIRYGVIDAVKFPAQVSGKHIIAIRNKCGVDVGPCTEEASSHTATVSRGEFFADSAGAAPIQLGHDGDNQTDATENYDFEFIWNLFAKESDADSIPRSFITNDAASGTLSRRHRFVMNAADGSEQDSSTQSLANMSGGTLSDLAVLGNVVSVPSGTGTGDVHAILRGAPAGTNVVKNNGLYEATAATCDLFPSIAESADNQCETTDPWDDDGAAPGVQANFDWPDVKITSGNSAFGGQGVITAYPTDFEGEACNASYDIGVDCE